MPLQATSGAASYDAFGGGVAAVPQYIEDVFSTWLYTGNDSTQTIPNGIDLSTKGGLVWTKTRNVAQSHQLVDTVRGQASTLISNSTNAASVNSGASSVNSFLTTGYVAGVDFSDSTRTYASWTFRKQPKFFDVVTWSGNGTGDRAIPHALASTPGCILLKRTSSPADDWSVYHTSLGTSQALRLNTTEAVNTATAVNAVSSSTFTVRGDNNWNTSGLTYVAYLFAHNAGGFGLTGTDNVISCGSFTASGSGGDVNLGYEPQWVMIKRTDSTGSWRMLDIMRGYDNGDTDASLFANTSAAETFSQVGTPFANGFTEFLGAGTYIYIAIRRGPMRTPTTGTSVFDAGTRAGSASVAKTSSNILTDLTFIKNRTSGGEYWAWTPRLVGNLTLQSNSTDAELSGAMATNPWDTMTGAFCAASNGATNSGSLIDYSFRRAPGFFDEVCFSGDGTLTPLNHNLTVAPELVIVKRRSSANGWFVSQYLSAPSYGKFETTAAFVSQGSSYPVTATTFVPVANTSGQTFVAYLFASCPGVSKVGSYTGTGTTQVINCGFAAGSRFVLIKRTDSTGDWYVWDSARGIVAGNDPYLLLNSTAAEVTNTDFVDTAATGFEISSTAPAAINASGGTFIFLAIA